MPTPVVTLVTQTVVAVDDPAFAAPTKFVGSVYTEDEAKQLGVVHNWTFARDGDKWRRVVASPLPQRVVESGTADLLLRQGVTVVLAGGGGIPVTEHDDGLEGTEAVIDKDMVAAHVAQDLGADLLIILTDVPAVMADWDTLGQRSLRDVTVSDLAAMSFPAGSMGPKVEAACRFAGGTGNRAAIGSLDDVFEVIAGTRGTQVWP